MVSRAPWNAGSKRQIPPAQLMPSTCFTYASDTRLDFREYTMPSEGKCVPTEFQSFRTLATFVNLDSQILNLG